MLIQPVQTSSRSAFGSRVLALTSSGQTVSEREERRTHAGRNSYLVVDVLDVVADRLWRQEESFCDLFVRQASDCKV